jgi:hypothetical protein
MDMVVSGSPVNPTDAKKTEPDKWEIDSWCRTLMEAEEIRGDKNKMKYVQPLLNTKIKAIKSLADLRAVADSLEPTGDDTME